MDYIKSTVSVRKWNKTKKRMPKTIHMIDAESTILCNSEYAQAYFEIQGTDSTYNFEFSIKCPMGDVIKFVDSLSKEDREYFLKGITK